MDKPCLFDCEAAKKLELENKTIKDERAKRETLWLDHQRDFLGKNQKLERENKKMRECLKDIEDTAKQLGVMSIQQITRYALKELEAGE